MGGKASLPRNRCPLSDKKWMDENVWKDRLSNTVSSVRAPHQLEYLSKPGYCDYCRIVNHQNVTKYFCSSCQLNFCFIEDRNDFKIWHSAK